MRSDFWVSGCGAIKTLANKPRNIIGRFSSDLRRRSRRLLSDCVPDRFVHADRFKRIFGRPLDLKHPQTFNEKLFWLMLYYRRPVLTRVADKYEVRSYIAERVGPEILNELYGVWDRVADIDFASLPEAFVLKVTWGSGMNINCPDKSKLNLRWAKEQLALWTSRNFYWEAREWCYKNIKPRIICERFLIDSIWGTPPDYKFFCFGGEPRFVQVDTDRFTRHSRDLFDLDWRPLPFNIMYPSSGRKIPRPSNFDEMVAYARRLSNGLPFVRVDFYSIDGRSMFGEMTWYPEGGGARFEPGSYDYYWGEQLQLPPRRRYWRSLGCNS